MAKGCECKSRQLSTAGTSLPTCNRLTTKWNKRDKRRATIQRRLDTSLQHAACEQIAPDDTQCAALDNSSEGEISRRWCAPPNRRNGCLIRLQPHSKPEAHTLSHAHNHTRQTGARQQPRLNSMQYVIRGDAKDTQQPHLPPTTPRKDIVVVVPHSFSCGCVSSVKRM